MHWIGFRLSVREEGKQEVMRKFRIERDSFRRVGRLTGWSKRYFEIIDGLQAGSARQRGMRDRILQDLVGILCSHLVSTWCS